MNHQVTPKAALGCLTVLIVVTLVATYVATSSLNPLAVYSSHSIVAKIIVSLSGLYLVLALFALLGVRLMRFYIGITAGKPADDILCPGCGLPLMPFVSSHGQPLLCPKCRTWWHNGPACYSKGLERRVTATFTTLCPKCREPRPQLQDLLSDLDDLVK